MHKKSLDKTETLVKLSPQIKEEKLCVCDVAFLLNISIASASHHLRKLYKQDVLDFSKDGKMVYYFIKDDEIKDFFS